MQITSEIGIVSRGRDVQEEGWRCAREESATSAGVVEGDEEGEMKQRGEEKTREEEERRTIGYTPIYATKEERERA